MKKSYSKAGNSCRVTFELPADVDAEVVALCGDFNDWDSSSHIMKPRKDGRYSLTLYLKPGESYRYRYLLDGERWENDWEADDYQPNEFGSDDSVVSV